MDGGWSIGIWSRRIIRASWFLGKESWRRTAIKDNILWNRDDQLEKESVAKKTGKGCQTQQTLTVLVLD